MNALRIKWSDKADTSFGPPAVATAGAVGADVRANLGPEDRESGVVIAPMERKLIPTGLVVSMPEGFELQLRPRSGLALHNGITLANSPATIDSDYRGEIKMILINLGTEDFLVLHGARIAQMVLSPVCALKFAVVEALDESERGDNGFGSTGLR
ncbi:MAG: dUTP diphosphatase [Rhodobacteraceae bacterium]|nr:dUTP diphosphatase [Paracoccaceae bacterium]